MRKLDSETIALVKCMVLCQTHEMPAIKTAVMAGCENKATRRMRFIEELHRRGMKHLDLEISELLDLTITAWSKADAARRNIANRTEFSLENWPAVRLTEFSRSDFEPMDWAARWKAAGESVDWQGAVMNPGTYPSWSMTALTTSPIWAALGNGVGGFEDTYGWPHPPFTVGSGLGWEELTRKETELAGLIPPPLSTQQTDADREIIDAIQRLGINLDQFTEQNRT